MSDVNDRTYRHAQMQTVLISLVHVLAALTKLFRLGNAKVLATENLALRHQLIVMGRTRERAPNLTAANRVVPGVCTLLIPSKRMTRIAVVVRPSTLLRIHRLLVQRPLACQFGQYFRKTKCRNEGLAHGDLILSSICSPFLAHHCPTSTPKSNEVEKPILSLKAPIAAYQPHPTSTANR